MSKYHKMDTNKYPNILGCHIMYQTNIRLYSDATYLPNKYPNIFVRRSKFSNKFKILRIYEQIFECIQLFKNLRMNIQIYLYWGNGTNTLMRKSTDYPIGEQKL